MWEFRVFEFSSIKDKLPDFFVFNNIDIEERIDYYYDFDTPEFGLKERMDNNSKSNSLKLELKIRLASTETGLSYWHKVLSQSLPYMEDKHVPLYQIDDILDQTKTIKQEYGDKISDFQNHLGQGHEIWKVKKQRWKNSIMYKNEYLKYEYVKGTLDGEDYFGITVESENKSFLENLIARNNLDELGIVTSYPGLFAKYKISQLINN